MGLGRNSSPYIYIYIYLKVWITHVEKIFSIVYIKHSPFGKMIQYPTCCKKFYLFAYCLVLVFFF